MIEFLEFSNNILTSGIVIITVSMLLYNITRNVRDRVSRASGILLGCVSWAYLADIFIGLEPSYQPLQQWFRLQWIGVALVPAALFHLSDALLATTGLVSRGKRRRATRIFYGVGFLLAATALFTDSLITNLIKDPVWHMQAGIVFPIYLFYFIFACSLSLFNVIRAWKRCLTTYTRRRMTYLMTSFLAPAWGLFPYSLLFSTLSTGMRSIPEWLLWLVFNVANLAVLAMLAFMAYPLSFYGAHKPDRLVKAELLQFMLRGPLTGVVIVAAIESFPRVTTILGIRGDEFLTLAAVGAVLGLQWGITLMMPKLESWLIYTEDQQQARLFQTLGQRLLTRADTNQLFEAILAAACDQLRVPTAFIASVGTDGTRLEQYVGSLSPEQEEQLETEFSIPEPHNGGFFWQSFWLLPLRYGNNGEAGLLGLMGIWTENPKPDFMKEKEVIVQALATRAAEVLADMRLQAQILKAVEELIPEPKQPPTVANVTAFGQVSLSTEVRQQSLTNPEFTEWVKNALRDYWGGPNLMESELLQLNLVDATASKYDGNRVNALRKVLIEAIEHLRPEGQQNFTRTDWILYNILEMRFIQGRKVRDVALRLAMSQADFYRKQRAAIEEVARIILELERDHLENSISNETVLETFTHTKN